VTKACGHVRRPNADVIHDNEAAARAAFDRGDYVLCFLLEHARVESLLRTHLNNWRPRVRFEELVAAYIALQKSEGQPGDDFVEDLIGFNRRRNSVVHRLSSVGYSKTNRGQNLRAVCQAAMMMYGLFIEWLETFDPDVCCAGFHYDK
jgi:hypothetical protein